MLLNLDFRFKTLDGTEGAQTAATIVSDLLGLQKTKFHAIDAYQFALELRKSGIIELKPTDMESLEEAITSCDIFPFAKAQILQVIKDTKERDKVVGANG